MSPTHRRELATLLSELDRICTEGDELLAEPTISEDDDAKAEKVIALLKQMRANVEGILDR
jgi:hypothetical protein